MPGRAVAPVGMWERVGNGALASLAILILLIGLRVEPSQAGHGSHMQLGLPPCGWVVAFDKPCPTCGMTTAVAYAVRGEILSSFITQPAGMVFALSMAMSFWLCGYVAMTGSALGRLVGREVFRPRILWGLGALILVSWAYKFVTW